MSVNDSRLYTVNDIFNKMSKEFVTIDGNVKKIQKENLTPYKVATVILIREYCNETTKAIVERRDFCLASLKLIQSADMELADLLNMLYIPEYTLHRFADQLEVELDALHRKGVDKLLDLFDSLRQLMEPKDHALSLPALSKNSVLGLYVRRMLIFFEKLAFDQVVVLYNDLIQYVNKKNNNPENSDTSIISKQEDLNSNKSKTIWGGRQAELLVAQQAYALQTDEHKALPPIELQTLVQDLLKSTPYNADAHYLIYLNCIRVSDFCGAVNSLYHCFDRLAPLENRSTPEDRSRTFRYAALNLAVLHAQFNHKEVAQHALKEAIKLAQEAGDNVCLQLAHSWMSYLTSKENKGPLIERSVGKASLLGITHTTGLSLISHAHNYALEAKSPPQVFDILMKSDMLNCQHSMSDLISITFAEKSALWAYYGKTEMASLCAQLLLFHNTGDKKQHMYNGSSTCQSIITVANMLIEFGEYVLADSVLAHAKKRFPNNPCNKIWMLSEQLHTFTQLMRQEKWSEAEATAQSISSLDQLECILKLAEICLAKGDLPKGLEYISVIEEHPDATPPYMIRATLLSSQITCASCAASPSNGTAVATNCIVRLCSALELATRNHLSYYNALVKMHLANVQLLMGLPTLALNLVEDAIPTILGHGGCYDQGKAFMLYGKCLVASAPHSSSEARKEVILKGMKVFSKAQTLFMKVNAIAKVKSTLHLQACFYNEIDLLAERNQCAFKFRQLDEQYLTTPTNPFLY